MHFWAEFYIPRFGWIPIDANYGDEKWGIQPKEFYFGNMDNVHIAFSKGKVEFSVPGKDIAFSMPFLQKFHSYMENKPKNQYYSIKRDIKLVL